jgi:hypothetical protein
MIHGVISGSGDPAACIFALHFPFVPTMRQVLSHDQKVAISYRIPSGPIVVNTARPIFLGKNCMASGFGRPHMKRERSEP